MKEVVVAKVTDLQNGEMQQIAVEDSQILLTKINDKFYATGAFCTHYGAPLATGLLCGERIICPWHNACFNAIAGQQEEPPGLNSLATFLTRVEGNEVIVKLPDQIDSQRTLEMSKCVENVESRVFVVLGAGAAGINAVERLRQIGFQGKVILVSAETKLPYDRTKLSKNYLQGKAEEDSLSLRSCEFYAQHSIELCFGKAVTEVDALNKSLTFADGSSLKYDSLLLATGGKAKTLDVPGAELANIFTIVPFKKVLGNELGKMFQKLHEKNGVTFKFGTKATEFKGTDKVTSVVLEDGAEIPTDLVIEGIGVQPNTSYLKDIQLNEKDRSIPVNEYLQTEIQDIYAAGDIASFPYAPMGKSTRIEHWRLAAQQGRIAAENMLHQHTRDRVNTSKIVPFFWSGQYDLKLRYVGHAEQWDEVYLDGDLESKFLAFYLQGDQVMAVAGVNRDKEIAAISELMRQQQMPDATAVKDREINWIDMV